MRQFGFALAAVAVLAGAAAVVAPPALRGLEFMAASDDPVRLSELRLRDALTPERVRAELALALAEKDTALAESLIALAGAHGLAVDPDQTAQLDALRAGATLRAVGDFGRGFVAGDRESDAGFAGALVSDVVGVGDLRDLAVEGGKYLRGEPTDGVVLALAAGGLALSAATIASLGAGAPARGGLSAVKAASRAGKLSPALGRSLARVAGEALDKPALKATLAAGSRLDLAGARLAAGGMVKPAALAKLTAIGQDAGTVYARTGQRGLRQALALSDDVGDLGKAARLAAAKPSTARAVLKLLGRSALVLGALSLSAAGWIMSLLAYALALAMAAQRLGVWLGRRRFRKAPRLALAS